MAEPIVTLYAPIKRGRDWQLAATVDLGNDTLAIGARVSPETIAWANRTVRKGGQWAANLYNRAKRQTDKYIRFKGDWKRLGVLGQYASNVAADLASSPLLSPYDDVSEGLSLYCDITGENGSNRQALGYAQLQKIIEAANQGDEQALDAASIIGSLSQADNILKSPYSYYALSIVKTQAVAGDAASFRLLQAVKALGHCCCNGIVPVTYDIESLIFQPQRARDLVGYASDVQTFRAAKRGPQISPQAASSVFRSMVPPGIVPPGIIPDECKPGDTFGKAAKDPYAGSYPYYGAGWDADEVWGSREGFEHGFNPDEYDARSGEWGYTFQ